MMTGQAKISAGRLKRLHKLSDIIAASENSALIENLLRREVLLSKLELIDHIEERKVSTKYTYGRLLSQNRVPIINALVHIHKSNPRVLEVEALISRRVSSKLGKT